MNYVLLFVFVAVIGAVSQDCETAFKLWIRENGESLPKIPELIPAAFCENYAKVEAMKNDPDITWSVGLTKFATMSTNEFTTTMLMPKRAPIEHPAERYAPIISTEGIPTSFDWRQQPTPCISPVRDQGSGGTCWAFSTAGNVEGQWALAGHSSPFTALSVEQLVDCCGVSDGHNSNACCGLFGGWPYLAYQYVIQSGLESWDKYPYCANGSKTTCYPCMPPVYNKTDCGSGPSYCDPTQNKCSNLNSVGFISNWTAISKDESQIAAQLVAIGPLSVLMNAEFLNTYKSGIFNPSFCSPSSLDHAVLIVGYGTENSQDYWTVKNSWGATWGENGYFRIARGTGKCGINTAVTSAIV